MSEVARDETTSFARCERDLHLIGGSGHSDLVRAGRVQTASAERFSNHRRQILVEIELHARRARPGYLASSASKVDRKSTRLNSSHGYISYAVFCLKKKKIFASEDAT